ncbi:MAG: alcohol dehydrogenase [Ectothiorhodospiraceae bacterium]|nr:alcohol dehydrogenase [Ectothiorhodospiraceae bacterium]
MSQGESTETRRYEFREFQGPIEASAYPLPEPEGAGVLLRVDYCGVCHSDVHIHEGYYAIGDGKRMSFADRGVVPPVTLGHEIVGTVVRKGPDAGDVAIGAQRLVYPWIGCGTCAACRRQEENMCAAPRYLGVFAPGGYADHVLVPDARYLVDIDGLDPATAAPLACSGLTTYSAIHKVLPLADGQWIAIVGCGGLGQIALRLLEAMGETNVIAVDVSDDKLALAKQAGAAAVVNATDADAATQLSRRAGGELAAVLDFVGNEQTANLALAALGKGGRYVLVGLHGGELRYPLPFIATKALLITGSYVGRLDELQSLVDFVRDRKMAGIPVEHRSMQAADGAVRDLAAGKVAGRIILSSEKA